MPHAIAQTDKYPKSKARGIAHEDDIQKLDDQHATEWFPDNQLPQKIRRTPSLCHLNTQVMAMKTSMPARPDALYEKAKSSRMSILIPQKLPHTLRIRQ